MKAIVNSKYGSPEVLTLTEVKKPEPKSNEILVRVEATAVNSGDWRMRKGDPFAMRLFFGLTKPKINILGSVFSGKIEAIGKDVKRLNIGDDVFGTTHVNFGTYAEYLCLPENSTFALKPNNIGHEEAAVIPFGATTALYWMKKANIMKGQTILIYGASGAVGTAAVQIAKSFGANVTAVCSTGNINLVKYLGADEVIDYTKEDFTQNRKKYDVIFDTVGKMLFSDGLKSLEEKGKLILSAAGMSEMFRGIATSMINKKSVLTGIVQQSSENIVFLKELIEAGKLKPVIDRTYTLAEVPLAHAYVEKGHKKGNVSITFSKK